MGYPFATLSRALWRRTALAAALLAAIPIGGAPAQAAYPDRPVRVILAYAAGGVADVTIRLVAQRLQERLGQQFVIDNRPGAGGITAARSVATAQPDGYTLLLTGNGATISASLFKSLPYDLLKDFTPISVMANFDVLLATREESPLDTVGKLVAHARANPGKLNFGTISSGSTQNLSAELFKGIADVNAVTVTFRGSPDLVTALLRGDADIGFDYLAVFGPPLSDRKLKLIAQSGSRRSPMLPDVPTVAESGYPEYSATAWNALVAPTGTPAEIITLLSREVNVVLKEPDIQQRAAQFGIEATGSTPEEMTERLKSDMAKWRNVIEKLGLQRQ